MGPIILLSHWSLEGFDHSTDSLTSSALPCRAIKDNLFWYCSSACLKALMMSWAGTDRCFWVSYIPIGIAIAKQRSVVIEEALEHTYMTQQVGWEIYHSGTEDIHCEDRASQVMSPPVPLWAMTMEAMLNILAELNCISFWYQRSQTNLRSVYWSQHMPKLLTLPLKNIC